MATKPMAPTSIGRVWLIRAMQKALNPCNRTFIMGDADTCRGSREGRRPEVQAHLISGRSS